MKQVQINGKPLEISQEIETVKQLINHLQLKSPIIIVEHNQIVLQKAEHEQTKIATGDKIEFVQFVGGG